MAVLTTRGTHARAALLPLLLLLAVMLAACGGDTTPEAEPEPEPEDETEDATEEPEPEDETEDATEEPEPEPEPPPDPLDITVSFVPGSIAPLSLLVAMHQGFTEEEGLNVDILHAQAGGTALQIAGLQRGEIQLVFQTAGNCLNFRSEDIDCVIVAGEEPVMRRVVVTHPDHPAQSMDDGLSLLEVMQQLEGSSVGTTGVGSFFDMAFIYALEHEGVDVSTVERVQIPGGAPSVAALQERTVDFVYADLVTAQAAVDEGVGRVILNMGEKGFLAESRMQFSVYFSLREFLDEQPEFPDRLQRALERANDFMADPANIDAVAEAAIELNQAVDSPGFRDTINQTLPRVQTVSEQGIQAVMDFVVDVELFEVDDALSVSDWVHPSALE